MDQLIIKYQSLSPQRRKEVEDFVDFILSKEKSEMKFDVKIWQEKIKQLPQWSEEDLEVFEKNTKAFQNWKPEEW